jgi:SAM-dependent methyltransferase
MSAKAHASTKNRLRRSRAPDQMSSGPDEPRVNNIVTGSTEAKSKPSRAAPILKGMTEAPHFKEIKQSFQTFEAWKGWSEAHPELREKTYIYSMARSIKSTGFVDPLSGFVHPNDVEAADNNYREGLCAHGLNSRHRAMMLPFIEHTLMNGRCSTIYLSEHFGSFAEVVIRRFPYVMTSEYMPNPALRRRLFQVRHEDPLRLTLPDHAFDLYLSSDQMIYAANMIRYLKEARRILRRTGQLIATLPFRYGEVSTEIRAQIKNGEIIHQLEPEYRDNPLDMDEKKLIFFIPGWNILDAAGEAGFSSAEIIAISSRTHGILGAEIATIFVLRAVA